MAIRVIKGKKARVDFENSFLSKLFISISSCASVRAGDTIKREYTFTLKFAHFEDLIARNLSIYRQFS